MRLFRWVTPRRRPWVVVATILIVGYGLTGGCYAQRIPIAPSVAERRLLNEPPLPYSVVVVPWDSTNKELGGRNIEAYSQPVVDLLAKSHAFTSVQLDLKRVRTADLVVASAGDYCNSAVIPFLSLITLGIVPTVFTDQACVGMVFRAMHDSMHVDSVTVHYAHEGRVVMGWLAIPIGFLPGWSHRDASEGKRYRERVRLEVLKHRDELARLAKQLH